MPYNFSELCIQQVVVVSLVVFDELGNNAQIFVSAVISLNVERREPHNIQLRYMCNNQPEAITQQCCLTERSNNALQQPPPPPICAKTHTECVSSVHDRSNCLCT